MRRAGVRIPTAWLLILPVGSLVWTWKYARGVQAVTGGELGRHSAFWILILLGPIGAAIVQASFNSARQFDALPGDRRDLAAIGS
jgi:hypothetical protein